MNDHLGVDLTNKKPILRPLRFQRFIELALDITMEELDKETRILCTVRILNVTITLLTGTMQSSMDTNKTLTNIKAVSLGLH